MDSAAAQNSGIDAKWMGLIGVVVGAFMVTLKDLVSGWFKRRSNAKYLATRAINLLDRFIDGCVDVVGDDGSVMGGPANEDGSYSPQADYPGFPIDNLDGDWKSISQDLMYELLSFSNRIESAQRMIRGKNEHASFPDYEELFEERQFQYAKLGLKAYELASQLRKKHRIPERERRDWDPTEYLREKKGKIEMDREKRNEQNRIGLDL